MFYLKIFFYRRFVEQKSEDLSKIYQPLKECVMWLKKYFNDRKADVRIPEVCSSVIQNGTL